MHLKRYAAPRLWKIRRKNPTWVYRPRPGSHSLETGIPLGVVIRDILSLTENTYQTRQVLNQRLVLLNKTIRKDPNFLVGPMDLLEFSNTNLKYRSMITKQGFIFEKTKDDFILAKIVGKHVLKGAKYQYRLHNGFTIVSKRKYKVGDTLVLSGEKKVLKSFKFEPGANVVLIGGKNVSEQGKVKEIVGPNKVYVDTGEKIIETRRSHLFVVEK
jgi:small subunit ribosomal protein S4e